MNKINSLLAGVFALALLAAPAFADNFMQVWECEIEDDDASFERLVDVSKEWTAAAKKIDGASEISAYLDMPIAGDAESGEFMFVMLAPSAAVWAAFMDGYDGSEAQAVDEEWGELASCSESSLWRSIPLQ